MNTGAKLWPLVMLGAMLSCAQAARVGIDARYNEGIGTNSNLLTGKDFDQFRATILAASNTLVSQTSFTASDFGFIDALVLRQSLATNDLFTAQEISGIHAFVNSGHGLLLLAEAGARTDGTVANLNQLAPRLGLPTAPPRFTVRDSQLPDFVTTR